MPARRASSGRSSCVSRPSTRMTPSSGLKDAGDDLDQGRFAGAILAKQRMDLAGLDIEGDAGKRAHARKRFLDARYAQQRRPRRMRPSSSLAIAASVMPLRPCRGLRRRSPCSTPASRNISSASFGASASVIRISMRDSGTDDEAAARDEFRTVGEHDQLVGALQQFRLSARHQRIALDHAERADRNGAHEHARRRIMLDRIVLERRDDQLLLAIDFAARQRDAALANCGSAISASG